jgi:hypothetical protein
MLGSETSDSRVSLFFLMMFLDDRVEKKYS